MGNSRSIKRSIQKHPLQVWRAKQQEKRLKEEAAVKPKPLGLTPEQIEEIAKKLELPQHIAFVNPPEGAAEYNKALYEKYLTEQAQTKITEPNRDSGGIPPVSEPSTVA